MFPSGGYAMPPSSNRQSVLRRPLSAIFGSEGNVRVLREMFRHGAELSAPSIAERAGLSRQHVLRVLGGLNELGVTEAVGVGRHPSYRIRPAHFLHASMDSLFRDEEARFQRIRDAIRVSAGADPAPVAVWLYGSVARGEDTPRSDVDVTVVIGKADVERETQEMRERLRAAEESLGFSASVVGISSSDVLRLSPDDSWWGAMARDAIALVGPDPARLAARLRRDQQLAQNAEAR